MFTGFSEFDLFSKMMPKTSKSHQNPEFFFKIAKFASLGLLNAPSKASLSPVSLTTARQ
jgi:hypothetical protein